MFHAASKIAWLIGAPSHVALTAMVAGAALTFTPFIGSGRALVAAGLAALVVMAFTPAADRMRAILEDRFPVTTAPPDGVIVLGGSIRASVSAARGQVAIDAAPGRLIETILLARRFPQMRIVYTGGFGELSLGETTHREADLALRLFVVMGIDKKRITIERESRNTYENALFTRELVDPAPSERWLLVTSAFHMPRAIGVFRKVGFDVVAYPTDFATGGDQANGLVLRHEASRSIRLFDTTVREWLGLVAYRLAGKTDTLFPAPEAS